jgi:excisionase family DNA binding protein
MRITYDRAADTFSLELLPRAPRARTVELKAGVLVHFDRGGRLTGLEIRRASTRYARAALERLGSPMEWLTLGQAAAESGLSAATLRKQIHNGRIGAEKRGHDWLVTRVALQSYMATRAPQGRPAARPRR